MTSVKSYWKDPEKWRKYQRDYNKAHPQKRKSDYLKYNFSPAGIWSRLGHRNKNGKRIISKDSFIEWYLSAKKVCYYCGIKEKDLSHPIKKRLEIDRKDNEKPYMLGNIELACPMCNSFKGDIFTCDDMRIMGKILNKYRLRGIIVRRFRVKRNSTR